MSDERKDMDTPQADGVHVITLTPVYNFANIQAYMDREHCKTADEAVSHLAGRMAAASALSGICEQLEDALDAGDRRGVERLAYALIDARNAEHSDASTTLMRFFGS